MSGSKPDRNLASRRRALKTITFSSGAAASLKALPGNWSLPVVDSVILPAHAQTSPGGFRASCSIPFSLTFSGVPQNDPGIVNNFRGNQSAGGPFTGNCDSAGFQFTELNLEVAITSEGGDQYRVNYSLPEVPFSFEFVTTITEDNAGFMGSSFFEHTVEEDPGFTLSGFPATLETTYSFRILPNGELDGTINGLALVDETAGP